MFPSYFLLGQAVDPPFFNSGIATGGRCDTIVAPAFYCVDCLRIMWWARGTLFTRSRPETKPCKRIWCAAQQQHFYIQCDFTLVVAFKHFLLLSKIKIIPKL